MLITNIKLDGKILLKNIYYIKKLIFKHGNYYLCDPFKSKMKPNQKLDLPKKTQVQNMFDSISVEYDFLNKLMTFGNDVHLILYGSVSRNQKTC